MECVIVKWRLDIKIAQHWALYIPQFNIYYEVPNKGTSTQFNIVKISQSQLICAGKPVIGQESFITNSKSIAEIDRWIEKFCIGKSYSFMGYNCQTFIRDLIIAMSGGREYPKTFLEQVMGDDILSLHNYERETVISVLQNSPI